MAKRKPASSLPTNNYSPDREVSLLAGFVRERRKANRLSQRELAELAGVGPRAIWDLERGKPTLRMDVVNAVLKLFGKTLGVVDAPRIEPEGGDT